MRFDANVPITLRGDGRFLTILATAETRCNTIEVAQSRFTIADLMLDCVSQCNLGYTLSFLSGNYVEARNVFFGFRTFNDVAIGGDFIRASSDKVTLADLDGHIGHGAGTGIGIFTGYSDIELNNVRLNCNQANRHAANAYGMHALGSFDTLNMNYVYLQDCAYGMAFNPQDNAVQEDITGANVILDGMERVALLARPSDSTGKLLRAIFNNLWAGAQGVAGTGDGVGILLDGGPKRTGVDGVQITNFVVPQSQSYGIALDRGGDVTFAMHVSFANGTITGWSRAAPGHYPGVAIGLTAPVIGADFSNVKIGPWAHVGSPIRAPSYRVFLGSKNIRVDNARLEGSL